MKLTSPGLEISVVFLFDAVHGSETRVTAVVEHSFKDTRLEKKLGDAFVYRCLEFACGYTLYGLKGHVEMMMPAVQH